MNPQHCSIKLSPHLKNVVNLGKLNRLNMKTYKVYINMDQCKNKYFLTGKQKYKIDIHMYSKQNRLYNTILKHYF